MAKKKKKAAPIKITSGDFEGMAVAVKSVPSDLEFCYMDEVNPGSGKFKVISSLKDFNIEQVHALSIPLHEVTFTHCDNLPLSYAADLDLDLVVFENGDMLTFKISKMVILNTGSVRLDMDKLDDGTYRITYGSELLKVVAPSITFEGVPVE